MKNVLQMSPVPADEPRARRWEWFENTATDTSGFFLGSLEDRAAKLQREAKENASGNSHDNEKVPMCADKADVKSPQPESDLPVKMDAYASNKSQGDPRPSPLLNQAHLRRSLITVEETRWPLAHRMNQCHLQKCRAQERHFTQPRQEVLPERKGNRQ